MPFLAESAKLARNKSPQVANHEPTRASIESALQELEAALTRAPESAELHFRRAQHLEFLGREEESRLAYFGALTHDPDHQGALNHLGRALILNRNLTAARTVLERAVVRYPGDVDSHVALGIALHALQEHGRARDALASALRLDPSDRRAHAGMAFVLDELGLRQQAQEHRRLGYQGRGAIELPYRGAAKPIRTLLLATTDRANAPIARFLDDHTFQVWVVTPEFHEATRPLPDHDLVVNAIGDADSAGAALRRAGTLLAASGAPVLNAPSAVLKTGRCENWERLGRIEGVRTPRAKRFARTMLAGSNAGACLRAGGLDFPLLLRSPGYHGGDHFERVVDESALPAALARLPGDELIALEFVDTRGADGKFRKYRVMIVGGSLYPLHAAIGRKWKLHYFSAEMTQNAAHRAEDQRFLEDMKAALGVRAMHALSAIASALGLDYGGIDFGLDPDGNVVVFEANATMIVPEPAADAHWEYRRAAVARIDAAVRAMLRDRLAGNDSRSAPLAPARGQPERANARNFSAGPGALPQSVLAHVQQAVIALPETGLSVLGMSHRSEWFEALVLEAQENIRALLAIPESHAIVFLQGGSSLQFSMIPMNFAAGFVAPAVHLRTGHWSARAIEEARCIAPVDIAWDGADLGYRKLPDARTWAQCARGLTVRAGASPFLHYVSNETVEGLQWNCVPGVEGVPVIADMSSDFLSRPIDAAAHGFIYAHAQKNLGPAGVTVCVLDRELLARIPPGLPPMLDYRTHLKHGSNYNTPPVFGVYVMTLVTRWLRDEVGGVANMAHVNRDKAKCLYGTLDALADVMQVHAAPDCRSLMNASFRFRKPGLDARFLEAAAAEGFAGLAGHRAIGGLRASLYNAVPFEAVDELSAFLYDFARRHA